MAVKLGMQIALGAALGLGLVFAGCGSSSAGEDSSAATNNSVPVVGNYPAAGGAGQAQQNNSSVPGSFFQGWRSGAGSSGSAAGSSGSTAGSSGSAAGSGGSAGMSSAAGASGSAGADAAAGSGGAAMDDPLDIFGLGGGAPSCDGLVCVEDKDCQDLYPDETAACKFTRCVDLVCSK